MGILLILAQAVLVILDMLAHVIHVSLWIVFLPAILFGALWLIAILLGARFIIDRFVNLYEVSR